MNAIYIGKTFIHHHHPCMIIALQAHQTYVKVIYKDLITGYENFKKINRNHSQETNPTIIYDFFKPIDLPTSKVEILYETDDYLYALDLDSYEQIQVQKTESMDTHPQVYDDCRALVAKYDNSWYLCEVL